MLASATCQTMHLLMTGHSYRSSCLTWYLWYARHEYLKTRPQQVGCGAAICLQPDYAVSDDRTLLQVVMLDLVLSCRYQPGEQVFLCYGKYTNLELLGEWHAMLVLNCMNPAWMPSRCPVAAFSTSYGDSDGFIYTCACK